MGITVNTRIKSKLWKVSTNETSEFEIYHPAEQPQQYSNIKIGANKLA